MGNLHGFRSAAVVTLSVLLSVVLPLGAARAATTEYDLSGDWSNTQNPFGTWSLYKSSAALFALNLAEFYGNSTYQAAWADQQYPNQTHVPVWMKIRTASALLQPGDIMARGAELDRTGSDFTSVVWTSPTAGNIGISGGIWSASNSSRTMRWQLLDEGTLLSEADMVSDGR